MTDAELRVREYLLALRDAGYRDFTARLIPTIDPDSIIGVRTPALRSLAKALAGTEDGRAFLAAPGHAYYEENNLHALLISEMKSADDCIAALELFLPHVDNWATCDSILPKAFRKAPPQLDAKIDEWLKSDHPYTVRYGVKARMSYYLGERFKDKYLCDIADMRTEEYYINMARAWCFASALTCRYREALPYIQARRLDAWTHNKSIQKAIESRLIPDERKQALRALKIGSRA